MVMSNHALVEKYMHGLSLHFHSLINWILVNNMCGIHLRFDWVSYHKVTA